jgi:glycosyltransferase involved in cell wall biosynthesis
MNIFHLTHTDINSDSRILKEIKFLSGQKDFLINGLGVRFNDESVKVNLDAQNINTESTSLFSRKFNFLPRQLRHPIVFLELLIKVLIKTKSLKIDVIHCHDTLVLPIGYLIKKIKKSKLIYDAHELESNKNGQTKFMSWGTLFIEKKCWKSIDLLITVSESITDWYDEHLGKKKSILVLNAPEIATIKSIEQPTTKTQERYFHHKYDLPDNTLIFLYLGFLTRGRGIEKIIAAFESPQIKSHAVFVGFGDKKDYIIAASKNNNKVHYHEAVKHDQVVKISRNADVGLCLIENISLSDYYCLPNKLFEYAFSGLPVLASDFPELKKMVNKYKLGSCCEIDSTAIQEAIVKIEKNPLLKIDSDLSELSWESQGNRLIKAYRSI